jgi:tRNA-dihydrouridine synthase 1
MLPSTTQDEKTMDDSIHECGQEIGCYADGIDDEDDAYNVELDLLENEEKKDDTMTLPLVHIGESLFTVGPPKLAVDRDWLSKLLYRHAHPNIPFASPPHTRRRIRAYVLAPMVDQSDLPFRLQCRSYGTNLAFTPMIHAKLFATAPAYRQKFMPRTAETCPTDRPLIAQLCGSNVEYMLYTALTVAPHVDAIDINCGCPQSIAKRGLYGAFLLEQETVLLTVVRHLLAHLTIPLTVKVRLLPPHNDVDSDDTATTAATSETTPRQVLRDLSLARSMALYRQLVDAGIHMLTVHGRTRFHKGVGTGAADWDAIRHVVDELGDRIPILANGSISNQQDVRDCLYQTRADGVMSSEAILEYPPLFLGMAEADQATYDEYLANRNRNEPIKDEWEILYRQCPEPPRTIGRLELALEYLDYATRYPPDQNGQGTGVKCVKVHVHRFLHADLQNPANTDIRTLLVNATTMAQLYQACHVLADRRRNGQESSLPPHLVSDEQLSWYFRHRNIARDCFGITINHNNGNDDDVDAVVPMSLLQARMDHERNVKRVELIDDAADCFASLFDES